MSLLQKLFPSLFGIDRETKERLESVLSELFALDEIFKKVGNISLAQGKNHPFKYIYFLHSELIHINSEPETYKEIIQYHINALQEPSNLYLKIDFAERFVDEVYSLNQSLDKAVWYRLLERNPEEWEEVIPIILKEIDKEFTLEIAISLIENDSMMHKLEHDPYKIIELFSDDMKYGSLKGIPGTLRRAIFDAHANYTNFDEFIRIFGFNTVYEITTSDANGFSDRFSAFWKSLPEDLRPEFLHMCVRDIDYFFGTRFGLCEPEIQDEILDLLGISTNLYVYIHSIPKEKRFEFLMKHVQREDASLGIITQTIFNVRKSILQLACGNDSIITVDEIEKLYKTVCETFKNHEYLPSVQREYADWKKKFFPPVE